jgi:hypothetical protein
MTRLLKGFFTLASICIWLGFSSCGSPIAADNPNDDSTPSSPTDRAGQAGFGIQCPYAYVQDPTAVAIDLSDCPDANFTLSAPLVPILLSADCLNMDLTARTSDRSVDDTFEVKPDGSFYLEMNAGSATLSNGCKIPLVADLAGTMSCGALTNQNYDKVDISIDSVWKQAPVTAGSPPLAPGCALPPGCMLHASALIHQCTQ